MLELVSGVRVRVMASAWVGLGFYFAALSHNFLQFYAFRIVQMQNGHDVKIVVEVNGYV